jgi:hypothetical protein
MHENFPKVFVDIKVISKKLIIDGPSALPYGVVQENSVDAIIVGVGFGFLAI